MTNRVLEISNLHKSYGDHEVLKGVSTELDKGDVVSIIGASGSGKTTLLRCVNLLEDFQDGSINIDGTQVGYQESKGKRVKVSNKQVTKDRALTGMVFQSFNLFPHKTVLENITLAPVKVQNKDVEEARDIAKKLLSRFDLADKADQYPDRLSGGQQQRVAIIRSLAVNPRLLLLDEITSALDPVLVNEVLSIVRDLKQDGMTMVLATHEMGFATQVADEVCFLESGNILERGSAEQVLKNPTNPKTQEFLKRVHQAGRL